MCVYRLQNKGKMVRVGSSVRVCVRTCGLAHRRYYYVKVLYGVWQQAGTCLLNLFQMRQHKFYNYR